MHDQLKPTAFLIIEMLNPRECCYEHLIAAFPITRAHIAGQPQQHQDVLGQDVHEHMATIRDLNAYAQQLRQQKAEENGSTSTLDSSLESPDQRQWRSKDDPSYQQSSQSDEGASALDQRRQQQKRLLLPPLHLRPSASHSGGTHLVDSPKSASNAALPQVLSAGVATAAVCAHPPPDINTPLQQHSTPTIPVSISVCRSLWLSWHTTYYLLII